MSGFLFFTVSKNKMTECIVIAVTLVIFVIKVTKVTKWMALLIKAVFMTDLKNESRLSAAQMEALEKELQIRLDGLQILVDLCAPTSEGNYLIHCKNVEIERF